jgi:hypothetical protein
MSQDDVDLETMITDADFFVDALFNSLGCPVSFSRFVLQEYGSGTSNIAWIIFRVFSLEKSKS